MTATMFGEPGDEPGDKLVYEALRRGLPDGALVYPQPYLVQGDDYRTPDYVIIYEKWGVIVLERV